MCKSYFVTYTNLKYGTSLVLVLVGTCKIITRSARGFEAAMGKVLAIWKRNRGLKYHQLRKKSSGIPYLVFGSQAYSVRNRYLHPTLGVGYNLPWIRDGSLSGSFSPLPFIFIGLSGTWGRFGG